MERTPIDSPATIYLTLLAKRPHGITFDPHNEALTGSRGEELRATRTDLVRLPAVGDPRLSGRDEDCSLISAR